MSAWKKGSDGLPANYFVRAYVLYSGSRLVGFGVLKALSFALRYAGYSTAFCEKEKGMNNQQGDQRREQFEDVAFIFGFRDVVRREDGEYVVAELQRSWIRWIEREVTTRRQMTAKPLERCPDGCYRPKARSASDCAAGCCAKWYAVRDADAKEECQKLADFWKWEQCGGPVDAPASTPDDPFIRALAEQSDARRYRFITANVYRAADMLKALPFSSSMHVCAEALNAAIDEASEGCSETPLERAARIEAAAQRLRQIVEQLNARGGLGHDTHALLVGALRQFDDAVRR